MNVFISAYPKWDVGGGVSCSVVSDSCNPMEYGLSGSSVHRISQARILEWVAIPFLGDLSDSRIEPGVSGMAGRFFTD